MLKLNKQLIQTLCKQYGMYPSSKLGQNFLIDSRVLQHILKVADIQPNDLVLEIGAGFGTLSVEMALLAKKVVAVEFDRRLCDGLQHIFLGKENVEIICADILKLDNKHLAERLDLIGQGSADYQVIANIPYHITAPILKKFLEEEPKPRRMLILAQYEVAQRITAKPGAMSVLAISAQLLSKPRLVTKISKTSFWPQPEVDSALMDMSDILTNTEVENRIGVPLQTFFKLVKIGFSSRRKILANNLESGYQVQKLEALDWLTQCALLPKIRAQELGVEEWARLARHLVAVS